MQCLIHHGCLLVTPLTFPHGVSSELTDRSSGRTETISHTTHQNREATTHRIAYHTYLLLGEQGLAQQPRRARDSKLLGSALSVVS